MSALVKLRRMQTASSYRSNPPLRAAVSDVPSGGRLRSTTCHARPAQSSPADCMLLPDSSVGVMQTTTVHGAVVAAAEEGSMDTSSTPQRPPSSGLTRKAVGVRPKSWASDVSTREKYPKVASAGPYNTPDRALMADIKACLGPLELICLVASLPPSRPPADTQTSRGGSLYKEEAVRRGLGAGAGAVGARPNHLHGAAGLTHLAQLLERHGVDGGVVELHGSGSGIVRRFPRLEGLEACVSELCWLVLSRSERCQARQVANTAWALSKLRPGFAGPSHPGGNPGSPGQRPALLFNASMRTQSQLRFPGATPVGSPENNGDAFMESNGDALKAIDDLIPTLLRRSRAVWHQFNGHEASSLIYAFSSLIKQQRQQLQQQQHLSNLLHEFVLGGTFNRESPRVGGSWLEEWLRASEPLISGRCHKSTSVIPKPFRL